MKVILIFVIVITTVYSLTKHDQWRAFKIVHEKFYKNIVEEKFRFQNFKDNLKKIDEHNAKYEKGESLYYMGVNQFADMTAEEFSKMLGRQASIMPSIKSTLKTFQEDIKVPDSIDWRDHGAVLDVKDQKACGACWAFSTTGALEGQNAIINNIKISLSEQELIDCSSLYGNYGCQGGTAVSAFDYINDHGIQSEDSYPFQMANGKCKLSSNETILKIKGYARVEPTEDALKKAIGSIGPIAVALYSGPIQLYAGGVFDDEECKNNPYLLDHAVIAIGYGIEKGTEFWLLKNSWGPNWGEKGFFRLHRNSSICGILLDTSFPILN